MAIAGDGSVAVTSRQVEGDRLVLINNQLSVVLELQSELREMLGALTEGQRPHRVLDSIDPMRIRWSSLSRSLAQDSVREFIVDATGSGVRYLRPRNR